MFQDRDYHSTNSPIGGTVDPVQPLGSRPSIHGGAEPTAPRKIRPNDTQLAEAFRNLESSIGDLKCMAALMDTAAEDTVRQTENFLGEHLRQRSGLKGYRIHVLTEEQDDALNYALYHLQDLIRALHVRYYKGYEDQAAS